MEPEPQLERFAELLCREEFCLTEACLLIAQDMYPDLDVAHYLARIDTLAATARQILARLLRNLKGIYLQPEQAQNALRVAQRMVMVAPHSADAVLDRGLAYYRLDCFRAALADLQDCLDRRPEARDADEIRDKIAALRLECARLN